METVSIFIDGKEYKAPKGENLLKYMLSVGIEIPYFCYLDRLPALGSCRLCIVLVENQNRVIPSCTLQIQEGLRVSTQAKAVKENQAYLLQAYMTRHPLDCPICDKAGECDLQNYGAIYGPQTQIVPVSALEKHREEHDWQSDYLEYYSNRCVVCYRCTRVCDYINKAKALYVEERGFDSNIVPTVRPIDTSSCDMCGMCVDVCPVGAIISKPFKFWSRSWLLQNEETVCLNCPTGCNIELEFGVGDWKSKAQVYRTKPGKELDSCAKIFFGYDMLNDNRIKEPITNQNRFPFSEPIEIINKSFKEKPMAVIISPFMTNEEIGLALDIAKKSSSYVSSVISVDLIPFLKAYKKPVAHIDEITQKTNFIFIGDDISSVAPVVSYRINGKVYKTSTKKSRDDKFNPTYIDIEKIHDVVDKDTAILVDVYSFRYEDASKLGETLSKLDVPVMPIPLQTNALGLYEVLKDIPFTDIGLILDMVKNGEIKSVLLFGEDLFDYFDKDFVFEAFKNTKLTLVTPFRSELSLLADTCIPMKLTGEKEGTIHTLRGVKKISKVLPFPIDDDILKELPKLAGIGNSFSYKEGIVKTDYRKEISVYNSSWILEHSKLLQNLETKNKEEGVNV
ncbi:MAG: 2Fe-2S iron-sulfur cluster-binding protein [Hydrogenobaculum sp.]